MKSHFKFDKQERNGIFFLLLIIIVLQGIYFWVKYRPADDSPLALNEDLQARIDSIKRSDYETKDFKTYPFNPNYITDYKGYSLGMSAEEIDRLLTFRQKGDFINSAEEFQEVTQVSDSLLQIISPSFKFPAWKKSSAKRKTFSENKKEVKGLNTATAVELKQIRGVGEVLSKRIIKFRDRLGGFLVNEQLYDVYGLEPNVVEGILERFQVLHPPEIKKININSASAVEIAQLVYINRSKAEEIVRYREENGSFSSLNEMTKMFNVSEEKIDRIGLYLLFKED
nr:helix-hairpin-helix domain-containing protein [Allomuricauda sp.]